MDEKNSYCYRQSVFLGSPFVGGDFTELHNFFGQVAARMAIERRPEEIKSMQRSLDEVVVGHRSCVLETFIEKHPDIDLDAFWSVIKDTRQAKSAFTKLLPFKDDSSIADFINVTAWIASNEGAERGHGLFPISKIKFFVGRNDEQIRQAIVPVTFKAICVECGGDATANAYCASVRRQILCTKIVCSNCHHVGSAVPVTTVNGMQTLGSYIDSIECGCNKCAEARKWLIEEAASRAKDLVQRSIDQICKVSHDTKYDNIPLTSEVKLGSRKMMDAFEEGLFKLGMSLTETLNAIAISRGDGTYDESVDDIVYEGMRHGYLKTSKVTLLADDLKQEVVKMIDLAWDGEYSLAQLESDLASKKIERILVGLGNYCSIGSINSPYVAIVHYQA